MHSIKLDIRWPIGILFSLQGALLAVYGLLNRDVPAGVRAADGVNLRWGLVMLLFGLLMLVLAARHRRIVAASRASASASGG